MELKKGLLAILLLSLFNTFAQEEIYNRKGLLKATATIAPSVMLNRKASNIYLTGFAEYSFEDVFSVRGDIMYFVDGIKPEQPYFKNNTAVFFGLYYHPNKRKNLDPYIGIQPGVSLSKPNSYYNGGTGLQIQASPSVALHGGLTFYIWKVFNFYADVAYVHSNLQGFNNGHQMADELIFSAGLGFHFNVLKDKK